MGLPLPDWEFELSGSWRCVNRPNFGEIATSSQESTLMRFRKAVGLAPKICRELPWSYRTPREFRFPCSIHKDYRSDSRPLKTLLTSGNDLYQYIGNRSEQRDSDRPLCAVVLFYHAGCPFCAKLAPSYNALGRAFPQLPVLAVSALDYSK